MSTEPQCRSHIPPCDSDEAIAARAAQDVAGRCKGVCEYDDDPHYHQPATPPPDALRCRCGELHPDDMVEHVITRHRSEAHLMLALRAQGVVQSPVPPTKEG